MLICGMTSINLLTSLIDIKISPLVITVNRITYLLNSNVQVIY
jgi:hypothetical protein